MNGGSAVRHVAQDRSFHLLALHVDSGICVEGSMVKPWGGMSCSATTVRHHAVSSWLACLMECGILVRVFIDGSAESYQRMNI